MGIVTEVEKRLGYLPELTPLGKAAQAWEKAQKPPQVIRFTHPPAQTPPAKTAGNEVAPAGWITDMLKARPGLRLTKLGRAANERMLTNMPDWMKFHIATTEIQGLGELLGGWFTGLPKEEKLKLRREQEEDQEFHDGFQG